jgi:hypothetical protein
MAGKKETAIVRCLLDRYGQTYAEEAGIKLADRPGPLYQLLVLATLLSARISADIAVAAARELLRYDERTATMLGEAAELLEHRWKSDLRRLRAEAGGDASRTAALLTEFPGMGPAGAGIFLREVQAVWPDLAPQLDRRVLKGAGQLGLPEKPEPLSKLAGSGAELARLAAGLVRVSRSRHAAEEIKSAAA